MTNHSKLALFSDFSVAIIILILMAFHTGCVTGTSIIKSGEENSKESSVSSSRDPSSKSEKDTKTSPDGQIEEAEAFHKKPEEKGQSADIQAHSKSQKLKGQKKDAAEFSTSPEVTRKKSNQQKLDAALDFCQASSDFWEEGDLESAIDALDQAYATILQVDSTDDPDILQQKEDLRSTIAKRIIEVYSSRFVVANGSHTEIPLSMNEHVEKALALYKGSQKEFFLEAYKRSGKYRPYILKELKKAGFPEELSWLPLIESGFKVRAYSRSRALGLWQFIASTGYKFGLERDRWIDERMDPEKSTKAAIAYLKELHKIFGDWETALAAYNCGEGRVLRQIREQKIDYLDNFWDLYRQLPRETAFYVPKFLAVLHIIKDPKAHGFNLPPVDEELKTDTVTVKKQVHLKTVSKHIGVSYSLLKELNPELRRHLTPERPYEMEVPEGKGLVLLAKMDEIPTWHPPVPAYVIHRVRRGQTLSLIARRYGTSVRAIMDANGLRSSRYIRTGWRLKVPTSKAYTSRASASGSPIKYVVRRGDSLWHIARRFGTTTKAIQALNKLRTTRLQIGQVLMVPSAESKPGLANVKTKAYRVRKGDSPYLIARKHGMKLSQFLRLNNLSRRCTIYPGQILRVKAR